MFFVFLFFVVSLFFWGGRVTLLDSESANYFQAPLSWHGILDLDLTHYPPN